MKKITTVLSIFVFTLLLVSCKQQTLQSYIVASHEKPGFISADIPLSFIQLKDANVSDDIKETIKSIKKINVVALPYKGNEEAYETEKNAIEKILKDNDDYKSIMRVNMQGVKVSIYYTGNADAINEVIAFGYSADKGVGVARILGENMNPGKIIQVMNNVKLDGNGGDFGPLSNMF